MGNNLIPCCKYGTAALVAAPAATLSILVVLCILIHCDLNFPFLPEEPFEDSSMQHHTAVDRSAACASAGAYPSPSLGFLERTEIVSPSARDGSYPNTLTY